MAEKQSMMGATWKIIYNDGTYQILDETEYFAVDKDYKQIAAFKEKEDAFEYVQHRKAGLR